MKIIETQIAGLKVIKSDFFQDSRGLFSRFFCAKELELILNDRKIVQINSSITNNVGAIRGMHYQNNPCSEMKIIRCLKGRIYDVAVDLRKDSPTFLKWQGIELTPESNLAYAIPEGFAHGFQVLEEGSHLLYLHTAFYSPELEGAVRFDDPKINISWPLNPTGLSEKDKSHTYINEEFEGI
jgi:dTDP-4-dehydrorhamnose 3,5-epimerase